MAEANVANAVAQHIHLRHIWQGSVGEKGAQHGHVTTFYGKLLLRFVLRIQEGLEN